MSASPTHFAQPYGDCVELNTCRELLDAVGKETLADIVRDYLEILETSAAVYEKNGDYACGIFSSGWCRFMDATSRERCGPADNREALACGRWHCHESCWQISKTAIDTGAPADLPCLGGIRIYAVPIRAGDGGEVVGAINFGYGDPPTDPAKLLELSERYGVPVDELRSKAGTHESRPPRMVEIAKARLRLAARLTGEIVARRRAEEKARALSADLERRVAERTAELEASTRELEGFCYSVSHDLRAPLRGIDGFSQLLLEDCREKLDAPGRDALDRIRAAAQRIGRLIDDLLELSRVTRAEVRREPVDLGAIARDIGAELAREAPGRDVTFRVADGATAEGDPRLLRAALENLLRNAWKFTSKHPRATIELGSVEQDGRTVHFVRDDGAGFDMAYAGKLFGPFQRLHATAEFEGTGIGLATVQRIVQRHGGRVWAEGAVEKGATFYFTL